MFNSYIKQFATVCYLAIFISGCASKLKDESSQPIAIQSSEQRIEQLLELKDWKINGKIAFIQKKERNSASINWQHQGSESSQTLDLTSYLGINVLHLNSSAQKHTLKVDGKTYQGDNLDELIYQLTGYILPTKALSHWIKAIPYSASDTLVLNVQTNLPNSLESSYQGKKWQISFSRFKQIAQHQLPTKLSIKQDNLTIKIAINQWHL